MTNSNHGQWPKSKTVINEITKSVFEHLKALTDEELKEVKQTWHELNQTNCPADNYYLKQGLAKCVDYQMEINKYGEHA